MGQLEGQVAFVTGAARGLGESVMLGFMHALNRELREQGIRVTALSSGGMRTPFITERFPDVDVGTLQDPQLVATRCSSSSHCPPRRTCPSW